MSSTTGTAREPVADRSAPHGEDRKRIKRINVAVPAETAEILEAVIEREGISLTEAVRRLVSIGGYIHKAAREEGASVVIGTGDNRREVVLLG